MHWFPGGIVVLLGGLAMRLLAPGYMKAAQKRLAKGDRGGSQICESMGSGYRRIGMAAMATGACMLCVATVQAALELLP